MRLLLLCLLISPVWALGQIDRSATEYTHENINNYISQKIFPDKTYTPVFFGPLVPIKDRTNFKIAWKIDHRFKIYEKDDPEVKNYRFVFFLGKRMNIIKAEAAYVE